MSTQKLLDKTSSCFDAINQIKRRIAAEAPLSAEELTECAGGALERCARQLLAELLTEKDVSGSVISASEDATVKRRFAEGLDQAGAALREALADSKHRHSVSQVLQRKMFEAESMLRRALKARLADAAPVAGIDPLTGFAL